MPRLFRRRRPGGRPSYLLQGYIFVSSAVVVAAVVLYTQHLIRRMEEQSELVSRILARLAASATFPAAEDHEFVSILREVMQGVNFPIVITDPRGVPLTWRGIGIDPDLVPYEEFKQTDPANPPPGPIREVLRIAAEFDRRNEPIPMRKAGGTQILGTFHYGESHFVPELRLVPLIQLGTIALLVFLGYLGYRSVKIGEQRSIWVGMAKETAHQLGTPISSLLGWMELLKENLGSSADAEDERQPDGARFGAASQSRSPGAVAGGAPVEDPEATAAAMAQSIPSPLRENLLYILNEMEADVNRTAQVASRFETIGSVPRLQPGEVSRVAHETVEYFRRRWARLGTQIEVRETYARTPSVYLHRDLLQWVFENLLRNSMDAIDGPGGVIEIATSYRAEDGSVEVRFTDNGRGMTSAELARAFDPGYTTKTRGWGLGLALAKRIVEDYHGGRIWAKSPGPGRGTTFCMTFPV